MFTSAIEFSLIFCLRFQVAFFLGYSKAYKLTKTGCAFCSVGQYGILSGVGLGLPETGLALAYLTTLS